MRHGEDDREGRTHLRAQRHDRLRSVACNTRPGRIRAVASRDWAEPPPSSPWPKSPAIVAGYDSTSGGREVVVQAGLRAGPGGRVFVVHAYRWRPWHIGRRGLDRRSSAHAAGRRALDDLFRHPNGLPDAEYILEVLEGRLADAINEIAVAREADAIVVGARRTGWFGTMLRSCSRARLLVTGLPVVVIPVPRGAAAPGLTDTRDGDELAIPEIETWWW